MAFDRNILADRLKIARTNKGFTQKELSKKSGVTSATISAYESTCNNKGCNPSITNAIKLANALNVSLDWLCGLSDNEKPENNKETDTETFLYSVMIFLNHMVVLREDKTLLVPQKIELKSFIEDYINIKEDIFDTNLLPEGFAKEFLIRGIVAKYRHKSIEELTTPNEK